MKAANDVINSYITKMVDFFESNIPNIPIRQSKQNLKLENYNKFYKIIMILSPILIIMLSNSV